MKLSKKQILLLLINAFIVVSTIIITINGVSKGASSGQVGEDMIGWGYFKPYTIDSNVFAGICSLCVVVSLLTKNKVSNSLYKLFYVSTVTITLTIMTVIFFLFPTMALQKGVRMASFLFRNDMLFFHLLNPILVAVSMFLMKDDIKISTKDNWHALIPMGVYALVYIYNVVIAKNWSDFYGFTFGGKMYMAPIAVIAMVSVTYLFGFIYRKLLNK